MINDSNQTEEMISPFESPNSGLDIFETTVPPVTSNQSVEGKVLSGVIGSIETPNAEPSLTLESAVVSEPVALTSVEKPDVKLDSDQGGVNLESTTEQSQLEETIVPDYSFLSEFSVESEPIVNQTQELVAEAPVVMETPTVEEPAVEAPIVMETPTVEEPVVETPPVMEIPTVEELAVEAPIVTETPTVEEPTVTQAPVEPSDDQTVEAEEAKLNEILKGLDEEKRMLTTKVAEIGAQTMETQATAEALEESVKKQANQIKVKAINIKTRAVRKMEADINKLKLQVDEARKRHEEISSRKLALVEQQKKNAEMLVRLEEAEKRVAQDSEFTEEVGQAKSYSNAA